MLQYLSIEGHGYKKQNVNDTENSLTKIMNWHWCWNNNSHRQIYKSKSC